MTQILTTAILMVLILAGCSGKDAALDVKTSVSTTLVVPSDASSCVAVRQTTTGTAPARDIAKAYIRIPKITFTKKNPANDMYIALIKISFTTPGSTSPYVCTTSGDALSALSSDSNWWGGG